MEEISRPSNIIGPLTFRENAKEKCEVLSIEQLLYGVQPCECMLCEENFTLPAEQQKLLTHLYMEHRLVISDVDQVAILTEYLRFWKQKFKGN